VEWQNKQESELVSKKEGAYCSSTKWPERLLH